MHSFKHSVNFKFKELKKIIVDIWMEWWGVKWRKDLKKRCLKCIITPDVKIMLSVVPNLWKQYKDIGSLERKSWQGGQRDTMSNDDCCMSITVRGNRSVTTSLAFGDSLCNHKKPNFKGYFIEGCIVRGCLQIWTAYSFHSLQQVENLN